MIVRTHELKIREQYLEKIHYEYDRLTRESYDRYMDVYREAWSAFRLSWMSKRGPDSSFLKVMLNAQENIAKLFGLNAPTRVDVSASPKDDFPWDEAISQTTDPVIQVDAEMVST
jgi:hypothetical protein